MSHRRSIVVAALVAIAVSTPVAAQQSESYAFIIYAEGYDLSIFRNGRLETYDVLVDEVIGLPLLEGDLVQTDSETFVEIQVMPSRTVIKVAENTTFEINAIGGAGGGRFQMTYGRLRARVERISGTEPFEVRGASTVAGVRGTDFGYDLILDRAGAREVEERVYVFEGEVGVRSVDASAVDPADEPEVVLREAQMVRVVRAAAAAEPPPDLDAVPEPTEPAAPTRPLAAEPIDEEISSYWEQAAFQEDPVDPATVEERFPGIGERVRALTAEQEAFLEFERMRREGILGVAQTQPAQPAEAESTDAQPESRRLALEDPPPGGVRRRLELETTGDPSGPRLRRAAGWFAGGGVVVAGAGVAAFYLLDGEVPLTLDSADGPPLGALAAGATLLTSGLISYLLGLIVD